MKNICFLHFTECKVFHPGTYDKKGQFITNFEGNQKVDTILNAFEDKR